MKIPQRQTERLFDLVRAGELKSRSNSIWSPTGNGHRTRFAGNWFCVDAWEFVGDRCPQCRHARPDKTWGYPLYEILPFVDVFLPNEREICRMAGGCKLDQAMQQFAENASTIKVKRGRNGCRIMHDGRIADMLA